MKLTKKSHACIRLEKDGRTLVIDPGTFSEEDAAVGADAILVTHEHLDHFNEDRLRAGLESNPAAGIWTLKSVAEKLSAAFPGRVHTVGHGDTFTAAGFDVQVHGELHAVIHPDIPRITNVGYLIDDGRVFHPGDALTVPDHPVETLMLPVMAPGARSPRSSTMCARSSPSARTTSTTPSSRTSPARSTTTRSAPSAAPNTCV
ncbi:hypothetical protein SAV31267_076490 [Streptomyces avermitilis]|uniref:Metallo-beta-lactamase domain-containing protein n=1 Tax=Streptomyces avermitilis TaxID=33903 RepID=A0A4D4N2C9_STRAX|nr:hypothetical protein SAV31267_076490 [Streptomyces avermitilis]